MSYELLANLLSWPQALILCALALIIIAFLPSIRGSFLLAATELGVSVGLSYWDKIWILILFIIAAILGVLAAYLALPILALIAAFFTILATAWWLFEFFIWPWDDEFRKLFFSAPWWAWLIGLLVLVPVALIIAILVGAGGWILVLIALIIALWWLIFVQRCGWIVWLDHQIKRIWVWWKEVFWDFIEVVRRVVQAVERWARRERREWTQVRQRRCSSWHWLLRWICTGFTYVVVAFWVVVEYFVKLIVYIVSFVVVVLWVLVTIIVGALIIIVMTVIRFLFWCW